MTAPLSMDEMGGSGGIIGKCAGKCQHFANPALALNPPFLFVRTKSPYPRRAEPLRGSPARWLRQAGFCTNSPFSPTITPVQVTVLLNPTLTDTQKRHWR
uniref:Uncharacterized protein n=1 Tax=Edwardsiella tarda TaxID=636 RepID=A4LA78_EDWTA|nr:hypothetical protein [Edwardsiella tarda]